MNDPTNKRTNHRVDFRVPCRLSFGTTSVPATSMNLSLCGALVELAANEPEFHPGSMCMIEISLGGKDSKRNMEIVSTLARRDGSNVGVDFRLLSVEALENLRNIVSHNAPADLDMEEEVTCFVRRQMGRRTTKARN